LMFNKCRFLTSNEYRKLKLKKLNESRWWSNLYWW
jgi:hypothetical protein